MPASDHGVLVAVRMGHAAAERDPPSRRLRLHRLGVQALVWMPPAQSTLRLAAPRAPPRLLRRPLLDLQTLTKALCCWTCFSSLQQIARLIARNGYVAVLWRSRACCLAPARARRSLALLTLALCFCCSPRSVQLQPAVVEDTGSVDAAQAMPAWRGHARGAQEEDLFGDRARLAAAADLQLQHRPAAARRIV